MSPHFENLNLEIFKFLVLACNPFCTQPIVHGHQDINLLNEVAPVPVQDSFQIEIPIINEIQPEQPKRHRRPRDGLHRHRTRI